MTDTRKSIALPAIVAVVAAGVLVAALVGTTGSDDTTPAANEPPTSSVETGGADETEDPLAQLARRQAGDPLAMGAVDAPVVMVNYSEFQCPFCGKFARDTGPALLEKYVETGTLRVEWRDFPYLGDESTTAAHASRAAAAQDKFWEFHDALFADQPSPNSGAVDQAYVEGIAKGLGLDVDQFRKDMSDPATAQAVQIDFEEGQAIGVNGTPTFLINGQPVIGAQPVEVFEQVIEDAAQTAGAGR